MIVQESFLKKIKDFGLNSYEAKIWTALLSRGVSTAGELSDIAGVPRSRSYDILESLEKKGFIVMKLGKPIKNIAIPPEEVVERVKKGVDIQAQEQIKILDQLRGSDILKELVSLHTQGIEPINPADLSGVIKGRTQVYNHLNTKSKDAIKELSEFAEVKNSKGHTGRFCLIDNKELAFMLTDDTKVHPSYDTAVWVNASLLATTLGRVLEQCPL